MTTNNDGESVISNLKNAIVGKVASLISTHNSDTNSHSDIRNAINNLSTSGPVTVEKQDEAESGYVATYVIKQNGNQVGSKINIPKDFLVKSGTVETCVFLNQPVGCNVGDKYIDLVINTKANPETDEHIYIKVTDLIEGKVDIAQGSTNANKNVVTDPSGNITTEAKPTIPTKTSDLTNDSNYTTATGHNHNSSYVKLSGGQTMTGNILIPSNADSSGNDATGHIPFAHTIQDTTKTVREILPTKKSFIGGVIGKKMDGTTGNQYDYVISARHRNGGGDGNKYGMYIRAPWSTNSNLLWAESNNGDYGTEKTILDSNNYSTYASPKTHNHDGTYIKTGTGTVTSTNIANKSVTFDKMQPTIFWGGGSGSTAGYIKMIKFKFTSDAQWRDKPITFDLYNRQRKDNIHVSLKFKNVGTNDPDVDYFSYTSYDTVNLYIYKEEASTWSIIIQKEANGNMEIANLTIPSFNRDYLAYYNMNTQISALPSNTTTNPLIQATQRTYGGTSNNNITAPAFIKSGGTSAQFLKANGSVETLNTTAATVTYTDGSTGTINLVTR